MRPGKGDSVASPCVLQWSHLQRCPEHGKKTSLVVCGYSYIVMYYINDTVNELLINRHLYYLRMILIHRASRLHLRFINGADSILLIFI